jgi:hypothetical protein
MGPLEAISVVGDVCMTLPRHSGIKQVAALYPLKVIARKEEVLYLDGTTGGNILCSGRLYDTAFPQLNQESGCIVSTESYHQERRGLAA